MVYDLYYSFYVCASIDTEPAWQMQKEDLQ